LEKCLDCGASYVLPQPTRSDVAEHFVDYELKDAEALERRFGKNRARPLSYVARYIQSKRQDGIILDVACGTGIFLAHFFQGSQWQACGVEISPILASKAVEKGVQICRSDIHAAKFQQASFDVITVLDAFCYFPEPMVELWEFSRVLRSDGVLVIELPLATSRIWRTTGLLGKLLSGTRQPLLRSSDHLFYYNPKSVAMLLERTGFQVLDVLTLPGNKQSNSFRDLMFSAYYALSRTLAFLTSSRVFLGPRFLIAARKTPTVSEPRMRR
jgi:SAM-dependent methyltransferase